MLHIVPQFGCFTLLNLQLPVIKFLCSCRSRNMLQLVRSISLQSYRNGHHILPNVLPGTAMALCLLPYTLAACQQVSDRTPNCFLAMSQGTCPHWTILGFSRVGYRRNTTHKTYFHGLLQSEHGVISF